MSKPPYRVPLVAETRQAPRNGLTVASTFAGAGGSCYGYELAGFEVVWANEIVPAARECYRLNHPGTVLDSRDIRVIQPQDILTATGLEQVDLLDGSPPCQSFSMAGKRERGWGKVTAHADGTVQVSDDLFFEYARLLEGLQPRCFVAENVAGLVKGVAKGYFKLILRRLRACGYRVAARVLDAQWLGVPQHRERLIFVGVREDLGADPVFPDPLPFRYSVRDALPNVVAQLRASGWEAGSYQASDRPSRTILADPTGGNNRCPPMVEVTARVGSQFARVPVDPDRPANTVQASGGQQRFEITYADGYDPPEVVTGPSRTIRAGRTGTLQVRDDTLRLPPSRARALDGQPAHNFHRPMLGEPSPTITVASPGNDTAHPVQRRRLTIAELRRICGFPDDYQLVGSYAEQWTRLGNAVPPPMMAAVAAGLRDVLRPQVGAAV